ncbi:alpha/beta fold hydrolase [Amaricoccus solimangrovi]|uniref:Alpha/beta hydrolase n=1 Tax=Amaricoccus solimangrovi TaxID=2589815 RepID=A0A501WPD3_9RHOB|nr:alpha/beta hydrolase [Amaricoccus solimangrovi]TPE50200.1 alpha/beta hydrolase [Amaricoccus solimangrovi]
MTRRFTTSDGLSLAYTDTGEGRALLGLPGLTRNAADFEDLAAALGGRHRLIALTSRGRHGSDFDPEWKNYNVAVEGRDVIELLDHLGLDKVTIVGTSRGGLIAMLLAAVARDRLAAVLLNDIGPEIDAVGLDRIMGYLGIAPKGRTYADVAAALRATSGAEFPDVPLERWEISARRWFAETPDGIGLNYDPKLRDAVLEGSAAPTPDMWPLFDAFAGIPLAVLRGANSDLLSRETVAEMARRRPDLIAAEVPNRGHVPFLDEPEALGALDALLARPAA